MIGIEMEGNVLTVFTKMSPHCQESIKWLVYILVGEDLKSLTNCTSKGEWSGRSSRRLTGIKRKKEIWRETKTWQFILDFEKKNLCSCSCLCVGVVCLQPWLHWWVHHQLQRAVSGAEPIQCLRGEKRHGGGLFFLLLSSPCNSNSGDFDILISAVWLAKKMKNESRYSSW